MSAANWRSPVPTLTFGIKTFPFPYEAVLAAWQEADAIPEIDSAWLWDHMVPLREPRTAPLLEGWTLLAALAAQTRRLRLGLMVTNNLARPPAVLAKMAATVDVISDGRLEFGIGAGAGREALAGGLGEYEAYGLPILSQAECIRRLDEACALIRRMWTEPLVDHEGRYYQLRATVCEPKPVQTPHPPVLIGGLGERLTLRVVARHADAWSYPDLSRAQPAQLAASVEQFRRKSAVLDEHCAALGRDPAGIERQVYVILLGADPAAARDAVRAFADAGATQLVVTTLREGPGAVHHLADEVLRPVAREPS
jgi:alkanesulfonate monooxygenase SsuD/methylene tetrahydromethanopterin reductase-like flavin-dependent oxidoreductase (luciferase family)